jgi:membrane-associated protease RseP (regulator of RpoE activity)
LFHRFGHLFGFKLTKFNLKNYSFRPFDEARRLGLQEQTEAHIRKTMPDEIGMLVCETVVPKGPASEFLEEGDILVSIDGVNVTKFVPLEEIMDSNVGKEIHVVVERGGTKMEVTITVQDLHSMYVNWHALSLSLSLFLSAPFQGYYVLTFKSFFTVSSTPDRYVEIGGAKLNNLSYQLARQFCVPCEGVYVCEPAGNFRLDGTDSGWIIDSVDAKPTPNLDAFIEVFKQIPDRQRIPVTYYSIADVHTKSVAIINLDRHWASFRLAVRNGM